MTNRMQYSRSVSTSRRPASFAAFLWSWVLLCGIGAALADSGCCSMGDDGTLGCDDPSCEAAVCAVDAFCCTTGWDLACVEVAKDLCGSLCDAADPCADDAEAPVLSCLLVAAEAGDEERSPSGSPASSSRLLEVAVEAMDACDGPLEVDAVVECGRSAFPVSDGDVIAVDADADCALIAFAVDSSGNTVECSTPAPCDCLKLVVNPKDEPEATVKRIQEGGVVRDIELRIEFDAQKFLTCKQVANSTTCTGAVNLSGEGSGWVLTIPQADGTTKTLEAVEPVSEGVTRDVRRCKRPCDGQSGAVDFDTVYVARFSEEETRFKDGVKLHGTVTFEWKPVKCTKKRGWKSIVAVASGEIAAAPGDADGDSQIDEANSDYDGDGKVNAKDKDDDGDGKKDVARRARDRDREPYDPNVPTPRD